MLCLSALGDAGGSKNTLGYCAEPELLALSEWAVLRTTPDDVVYIAKSADKQIRMPCGPLSWIDYRGTEIHDLPVQNIDHS